VAGGGTTRATPSGQGGTEPTAPREPTSPCGRGIHGNSESKPRWRPSHQPRSARNNRGPAAHDRFARPAHPRYVRPLSRFGRFFRLGLPGPVRSSAAKRVVATTSSARCQLRRIEKKKSRRELGGHCCSHPAAAIARGSSASRREPLPCDSSAVLPKSRPNPPGRPDLLTNDRAEAACAATSTSSEVLFSGTSRKSSHDLAPRSPAE